MEFHNPLLNTIEEMRKALTIIRDTLEHKKNESRTTWSLYSLANDTLKIFEKEEES